MASSDIIRLTKGQLALLGQKIKAGESLTGTTDPTSTTEGVVGQTYVNTTTGEIFYCSAVEEESGGVTTYIWNTFGTSDVISMADWNALFDTVIEIVNGVGL